MNEISIYKLILVFGYSLFATWVAIEYSIKKLRKYKYLASDMYKPGKPKIPTMGGIAIFIGIMVSLALTQLLIQNGIIGKLFIFYFVVLIFVKIYF